MSRIEELVRELRAEGIEVGGLEVLDEELQAVEDPGVFERLQSFASTQWDRALGELDESAELLGLVAHAASGEALEPDERARLEEQLRDVVRMVPATALTVGLKAIPGGTLVTPWVLRKLGLLPSRWREAHMLAALRDEAEALRAEHPVAALRIDVLRAALTQESEHRAVLQAELQAHWDHDRDGLWDPEETAAYEDAVRGLKARRRRDGWSRGWYLACEDRLFGPTRLEELVDADLPPVLVSWEGEAWVRLQDLLEPAF